MVSGKIGINYKSVIERKIGTTYLSIIYGIKKEVWKLIFLKLQRRNENKNTTNQNIWDVVKSVLRRQFIALNSNIRNKERSQSVT